MHPWLHNNYLKFLDPWALGPHHPRFLLKNHWILSLVAYTTFKLHWNLLIFPFLAWNHGRILKYLSLKIRSEPIFQFSKMAAPSCIDNEVKSLAFSFSDFFGWDYDVFLRTWCHYRGIPPKIEDSPQSCMISCRNVHYDTLIESNDTCFVQNFNKSLSPPPFPTTLPTQSLPHPHSPTSLPTAICVLQSLYHKISFKKFP